MPHCEILLRRAAAMCRLHCRFGRRKPFLSAVGRLDKDTSGLLLMTDDGQLLHSIQSPTKGTVNVAQAAAQQGNSMSNAVHGHGVAAVWC
jgi:16S rRNA U516 pseudouridylate synthase RsuA-like enzyme